MQRLRGPQIQRTEERFVVRVRMKRDSNSKYKTNHGVSKPMKNVYMQSTSDMYAFTELNLRILHGCVCMCVCVGGGGERERG